VTAVFEAIGIAPEEFITQWLLPCGIVAAVVVAGWLVEAKQSVVENIAPVLARLFTPLEPVAGAVVAHGGAGIGVPGGDPHVTQVDAGVEHSGHTPSAPAFLAQYVAPP
jgi:hypothetical protein